MAPGKQFSGFLSSYEKLTPNPKFDGTLSYANKDVQKNLHKYFAVIVDPVEVYLATGADASKLPDRGRTALAEYFGHALRSAVLDAFPVVQEPGPLVLRLRTALIGVDVGGAAPQTGDAGGALERDVNIAKVGVEMELVDSETGEQIAAAVDKRNLGEGAVVGSVNFSRDQKFRAAKQALTGGPHDYGSIWIRNTNSRRRMSRGPSASVSSSRRTGSGCRPAAPPRLPQHRWPPQVKRLLFGLRSEPDSTGHRAAPPEDVRRSRAPKGLSPCGSV